MISIRQQFFIKCDYRIKTSKMSYRVKLVGHWFGRFKFNVHIKYESNDKSLFKKLQF